MDLLAKLSNADAIAAQEQEVRDILYDFLKDKTDRVETDGLGSIIFEKIGSQTGPKIMICSHMDEVGFMVRQITPIGQIMVISVGGVKPLAHFMQSVRITTQTGHKVFGILQAQFVEGQAQDAYVDIGATTAEEVRNLGVEVGNRVTYTTAYQDFALEQVVAGKAFDDRIGCYVMAKVMEQLHQEDHPNRVYGVGTSSEEVGIRGARTATYKVDPDVVLILDVACYSDEFDRSYRNQRQIGQGLMITHFDRTLAPNPVLIDTLKTTVQKLNKKVQLDMFNTGGTDGGEAHKVRDGKPTAVMCCPVRYGHCAFSLAHTEDIQDMITVLVALIKDLDEEKVRKLTEFIKGDVYGGNGKKHFSDDIFSWRK